MGAIRGSFGGRKNLKNMSRKRRRIYQINPEALPHAFVTGNIVEVLEGIPGDAEFRGYTIDPMTDTIQIFLEHASFDEVEEGLRSPIFEVIVRSVRGDALKVYRRMTEVQHESESWS